MSVAPPQDAGEAVLDQFADQNFFDVMEKMEYNDLLTLSQKLKLDTSGEKYDLVGRLMVRFPHIDEETMSSFKVDQLKDMCRANHVKTAGKKAILVRRLIDFRKKQREKAVMGGEVDEEETAKSPGRKAAGAVQTRGNPPGEPQAEARTEVEAEAEEEVNVELAEEKPGEEQVASVIAPPPSGQGQEKLQSAIVQQEQLPEGASPAGGSVMAAAPTGDIGAVPVAEPSTDGASNLPSALPVEPPATKRRKSEQEA